MGQSLSFQLSYDVWLKHSQADEPRELDDQTFELIDDLEKILLRHVPRSIDEAVMLMNVIRFNVGAGGRCDNLDVGALENLIAALPGFAQQESDAGGVSSSAPLWAA